MVIQPMTCRGKQSPGGEAATGHDQKRTFHVLLSSLSFVKSCDKACPPDADGTISNDRETGGPTARLKPDCGGTEAGKGGEDFAHSANPAKPSYRARCIGWMSGSAVLNRAIHLTAVLAHLGCSSDPRAEASVPTSNDAINTALAPAHELL